MSQENNTVTEQTQNERITQQIHRFAQARIRKTVVSRNDSRRVYSMIRRNNHNETIELKTEMSELWLKSEFHRATGLIPTDNSFSRVMGILYANGVSDSNKETIYNRIAMVGQTLFYDLGRPDWRLLRISRNGVEIVDMDENTPLFERGQSQRSQVIFNIQEDPSSLEELVTLLRIPEDMREIFKVHLIGMMLEHVPVPIMVFSGSEGSTKTTISRAVKAIIDPSSGRNVLAFPHRNDDLDLILSHRYLAAFDNVSNIDTNMSDTLCRAITGIGQPRRRLFHDEDEVILSYRSKIILNGIGLFIHRPDLLARTIYYPLNTPTGTERLTEEEFKERFSALLPRILGHIPFVLQRTLQTYQSVRVEISNKSRNADFIVYGEAISRVLGNPSKLFVDSYERIKGRTEIEVSENHPLVRAIERIMEERPQYEETIQTFYNEITQIAEEEKLDTHQSFFPSSPNRVRGSIERISSHLRTLGYEVVISQYTRDDRRHPRNRFVICIDKIENASISPISTATLAS